MNIEDAKKMSPFEVEILLILRGIYDELKCIHMAVDVDEH